MPFFREKKVVNCAVCNRPVKHKYKPSKNWNIEGFLCADCHIEKTKEFTLKEQEPTPDICAFCKREIEEGNSRKPRWQWNLESGTLVCQDCFDKKELEFNKRVNYCASCGIKMGIIRYNPKPTWNIEGQLCRKCWDSKNRKEVLQ
jgi:hypothetical protein